MARTRRLPNGFGNISKLPGNRRKPFRARVCISCKLNIEEERVEQKYKNIGYYTSYEEALIALTEYHKNPYNLDASKITFGEVFDKWSDKHYTKISRSNILGYNAAYALCSSIDKMVFADIRLIHLQMIVDTCGKNYPTLRKLKVLFNMLYDWGMKNDICAKDYSKYVDIIQYKDRNPNTVSRNPFTKKEIDTLWKWSLNNTYISIVLMMIYSGVRIGELRDLKKEHVYLDERYFFIEKAKTSAGIRNVPIAKKVLPFFEYWMQQNTSCEYLITNQNGKHFTDKNFRDSYWKAIIEETGLNLAHKPHDTRHTCISMLATAKIDERIIKRIVGHAGKGITETVYTHLDMEELIKAIDTI
jgi:integrase